MAKANNGKTQTANNKPSSPTRQNMKTSEHKINDVWDELVSPGGIIFMTIYLIASSILLVYAIFQFWPPQLSPDKAARQVEFLSCRISISPDLRLLAVVVFTGALGGQIHSLRSFASYVGNRKLKTSWLIQYILTPFVAASLALVFYFVMRAGFFPANSTTQDMNVYGFAGLAGLVGLFSTMAVNKLRRMAEELLGPVEEEQDPVREKSDSEK
jgi:hypothetical protein